MPYAVTCPSCGADGTAMANAMLAQSAPAQPQAVATPVPSAAPVAIPTKPVGVSLAAARPTAPRRPPSPLTGQADRTQAKHEARAKISWGDPPREVLGYLMGQGFSVDEASAIVQELVHERTSAIRSRGIANIVGGIGLILVPLITLIIFLSVGYIWVRIFVATIAVGLAGIWFLIKGCSMVIAPKSEEGDAAGNN
jgi:uncharacterized membrane protein YuzA (DUF378 family)